MTTEKEELKVPKVSFDPTRRMLAEMRLSTASAVNFIREDAVRNVVAKRFVAYWDDLQKNKRRCGRIDLCCREAGIPADEVRGIILRMWMAWKQNLSTVIQLNAMPEIVETSVEAAKKEGNYAERLKHLESQSIVSQPPVGGINVTTNIANLQPAQERKGLPDFDEHMRQMSAGQKQLTGETVDAEIVE